MSNPNGQTPGETSDLATRLGRSAARLVRAAKTRLNQVIAETRPNATKTGRQALEYAREHEDGIRRTAANLIRTRVRGPLGFVIDAVAGPTRERIPTELHCTECAAANVASARFCNQCGSPLTV